MEITMNVRRQINNTWLKDAEYTLQEEIEIYNYQLKDIIANPRWYLDNVDKMGEYKVSWATYRLKSATLPYHLKLTIKKRQH